MPRFMRISERYKDQAKVLILDCVNTPKHPRVDRIPMLLIYRDQVLLDALPGLAEDALESAFKRYTQAYPGHACGTAPRKTWHEPWRPATRRQWTQEYRSCSTRR